MTIDSYQSFAEDLRSDFKAGIVTPNSLPVQWENLPFQPEQNVLWIAYDHLHGDEDLISIGPPKIWRHVGVLFVRIYTALEKGSKAGRALADLIADRYRGSYTAGATFRGASISNGRREDDWYVTNAQVRYFADRHTS